jgi:uncharacterized repeat protein (TIGR02059 family)
MSATTYYIAPSGNDSNPGTSSQPFFTLKKAWSVITAGDIVYLRGGIYRYPNSQELTGKNGTSSSPITIMAYPGEVPIVSKTSSWSYSNRAGIYFEGSYFHWKGIIVSGFTQIDDNLYYAMVMQYSNHNTVEQMSFCYSGLGFDISHGSTDNLILNSDFHHNSDPLTSGDPYGNADGANAHTDGGTTNTFRYCRFYANSDDGIDLYNGDGLVLIDGCWSYMNGYRKDKTSKGGDGYGYKLGKTSANFSSSHLRTITNCLAFHNRLGGFGINEALCIVWLYNNTAYHCNDGADYSLGFAFDGQDGIVHVMKNNVGWANQHTSGLEANWTSQSTQDHNSWDGGVTVSDADFITTDSTGVSGSRSSSGDLPVLNFLHLAAGSDMIDKGTNVGLACNNSPDLGAYEYGGAAVPSPSYVSAAVDNATPSVLGMTYNLTLTNIVPSVSAFSVMVNSVARTINSISISGTKVNLNLSSSIAYGDVVTVAYSVPSSNPLQTSAGGQAQSISSQTVTNNVGAVSPVYISSAVANATPSMIEVNYNMALANITPYGTSFTVLVNSISVAVNSVAISGTKVQLYLATSVAYGNSVTVAYTKPSSNPIQSTSGGQAPTLSAQTVTNSVVAVNNPVYVSSVVANASPSLVEINFNMALASITPVGTSFTVLINSVSVAVNSVAISGTKVQLYLANAVAYGNVLTVAYTKPSSNPVQSASGAQAPTFSAQTVTNNVGAVNLVYVSSSVENAYPSRIDINYNSALANITPYGTAYTVLVNSVPVGVTAVAISGSKVQLYLASPVAYGNTVSVAYTKPASSPIQSTSGGQAPTFSALTVTNNIGVANPAYVSSSIENAYPSRLEITYNMALANVIPYGTAFTVLVNSAAVGVTSVAISGSKVQLYLAAPVAFGNTVTVAYTKPASNPVQATSGGQAPAFSTQTVTNNMVSAGPAYVSSTVENAYPSRIDITYNMALASITPYGTAYTVLVNSVARGVAAVAISGTKVQLYLDSPIAYGNTVTIAYAKPASSAIQATSGLAAPAFGTQTVTNNLLSSGPAYVSSSIENVYPSRIDITYNMPLASITPYGTAYTVLVNSVARGVVAVAISGSKVQLYLTSPVASGNIVTLSYTKPSSSGIQTSTGVTVPSFSTKTVTNNCSSLLVAKSSNSLPVITLSNPLKGNNYESLSTINIDATASDPDGSIISVQFFNGKKKLVDMTDAPYSFVWKDVAAGSYIITAIAIDNKNDTAFSAPVQFTVGIPVKYDPSGEYINIYPNPNDGHFTVDFVNPIQNDNSEIVISDLTGKQVFRGFVSKEELSKHFDLSEIKSGIYVLMIRDKEIITTKKFIKK